MDISIAPSPARGGPERTTLEGRYCRLEPIHAGHTADLFSASREGDGAARFTYLFEGPPENEGMVAAWVEKMAASSDPLFHAVIDRATGRAEGRQALMRIEPAHGVVELGGIFWGARIARTRVATEAFYLAASYVFDTLGFRRFEWKCNNLNAPSKAAARRFGFVFEGVFRQHMIIKGLNRDTAWFSMLDSEWPERRAALQAWLDPANFDDAGQQRQRLAPADPR